LRDIHRERAETTDVPARAGVITSRL
jgi:hypothetical protein